MGSVGRACRLWRIVVGAAVALSALLILAIALLVLIGATARYGFGRPLGWNVPVASYLLLYAIYLSVACTLQNDQHIRVTFVLDLLGPRMRARLEVLGHLLGLSAVAVLLWHSGVALHDAISTGATDTSVLHVPEAATKLVMPLGLAMLVVTYVFVALSSLAAACGLRRTSVDCDVNSATRPDWPEHAASGRADVSADKDRQDH